jgi:hypothetical protein
MNVCAIDDLDDTLGKVSQFSKIWLSLNFDRSKIGFRKIIPRGGAHIISYIFTSMGGNRQAIGRTVPEASGICAGTGSTAGSMPGSTGSTTGTGSTALH